jgi:hypothetical protein
MGVFLPKPLESRRLIAKAAIPGAQAPVERDVATGLNGFIFIRRLSAPMALCGENMLQCNKPP